MKFINFGCWNRGICNLEHTSDNPNTDAISVVLNNIKSYVKLVGVDFMVITGDNYYPHKSALKKVHDFNHLKLGFDCLENIPTKKYILFGNHEYNDIYSLHTDVIDNPYFPTPVSEPIKCVNLLSQQQLLAYHPDFILFDNVLHKYDEDTQKLLIMIDTTIYEEKIETECYAHIFSDVHVKTIDNIKSYQLEHVNNLLDEYSDATEIIITGHHPIVFCKTKKTSQLVKETEPLIDFFNNLTNLDGKKIVYICADTHFYQKGSVTLNKSGLVIEQHIVGTGGAKCDKICNPSSNDFVLPNIHYKLELEINEYGYLLYDHGTISFHIVSFDIEGKRCYTGEIVKKTIMQYTRKYSIIYD